MPANPDMKAIQDLLNNLTKDLTSGKISLPWWEFADVNKFDTINDFAKMALLICALKQNKVCQITSANVRDSNEDESKLFINTLTSFEEQLRIFAVDDLATYIANNDTYIYLTVSEHYFINLQIMSTNEKTILKIKSLCELENDK